MEIKSSAFKNSEMIPAKYTFDGLNVSPPLSWDIIPKGVKSIALICDDPDAPLGTWGALCQAFGTEENYAYCEEESIEPYLKFGTFHNEQSRKFKENIFNKENFRYNNIKDVYICPSGKELKFKSEDSRITATGYKSNFKIYACKDCSNCHYKAACCPHGKARQIQINEKLERYKLKARELLNSDEGIKLRKKRGNEVETVFGDIKHNQKFRRFSLRGKLKVNLEAGLLAIAYNIRKIRSKLTDNLKKKLENAANLMPQNFNFVFCN